MMKNRLLKVLTCLALISAIVIPGNIAVASGHISVTGPGTLDVAGATYILENDFSGGLVIAADNIILDGNGYSITGSGSGNGVLLDGRTGVTVKNLKVKQFYYGIYLISSSGNTLGGNTASNNVYGIYLISSSGNTLSGNTASNNSIGISLNSSSGNTLSGNTASNNVYGIYLSNNTLSGNTLSGNTASNNYTAGIVLHFSGGNTLSGNTASNNNWGIILISSSGNTLSGNIASHNYYGISLSNNTLSGNTLSGNTASNNTMGIRLISSSYNKVYNNNFINNFTQAYVSGGSDNAFNLAKPAGGNYWSDWTSPDGNGDGFVDKPFFFTGGQDDLPWTVQDGWLLIEDTPPQVSSLIADPNPASVGSPVIFTATVDDSGTGGSNIAFAEYRIDDGQWISMTAADGAFDSPVEDVTATTAPFTRAGVYNIDVRGQDSAGNYSLIESILLAVYDPDAGFVTGAGWIDSPAGAYTADPSLTGKATFGFVSRYQRGATTPSGRTRFQFRVASLTLQSDSYQWLVVAGARAQYKGVGTINGEGNYGFMLTAIDGEINGGGGSDKFRIKIWDRDSDDAIVYDNQIGEDDGTVIGGGNIVINER